MSQAKHVKTKPHARSSWFDLALIVALAICSLGAARSQAHVQAQHSPETAASAADLAAFAAHLETLRQALQILGLSAAVVRDQTLIWAQGFGVADLENQRPATPDTPYSLASVTKPVAAVLVMQLVQEGAIDLDAPIAQYGVAYPNAEQITVRHLLTHTAEGVPGTRFTYNGNRYALLGGVIEGATGKTFAQQLGERVLLPLGLRNTALNPISNWGPGDRSGLGDLQRGLGWGELYRRYPDVYARLAKPYQFGPDYEPVPGMAEIYHNPAAGLLSSVTDLAAFDIALDRGLLLEPETQAEMFAPAYSTYQDRPDPQYGLGWYVQEFEGQRLLWHTGRWTPSVSALYLKLPDRGLTLIVLANTDNLTAPFSGLGHGDVSKSALTLAFYRYFVYPEQTGGPLLQVDWSAPQGTLIEQLSAVDDATARRYLERELWAYRQVYASVGCDDQVRKLADTSRRIFPQSRMRSDPLFVETASRSEYEPPILSPIALSRASRYVVVWFGCVLASLVWMLAVQLRSATTPIRERALWLLATLFLGPLALVALKLVRAQPGQTLSTWGQALKASIFSTAVYVTGWALAFALLRRLGEQPHPLATLGLTTLTPIGVSLVLHRAPRWWTTRTPSFGKWLAGSLLSEVALFGVAFAVLFATSVFVDERLLSGIPGLASVFFLATLSALAVLSLVALLPTAFWLAFRGLLPGPPGPARAQGTAAAMRTLRTAWPHLLVALLAAIVSLVLTVSTLA